MKENPQNIQIVPDEDPTAASRKTDHIKLAFESAVSTAELDDRFIYEPMLAGHASKDQKFPFAFGDKNMDFPLWVSSMTGGTQMAAQINKNLAKVCNEFGLGMGLGSCRQLLRSDDRFDDFDIKPIIGDQPFYANLGIAQLEQILDSNEISIVDKLIDKLKADGLIIHVNPLQEWMQPEGDCIHYPPIETIKRFLEISDIPVIVKEVGQGIGKESLRALLQLPIQAIELAANGGTNFSKLELLRADQMRKSELAPIVNIGHSAQQMILWCNELHDELSDKRQCNQLIISGGIKTFLDGYYLMGISKIPAIYAQASGFLKYATDDYNQLREYTQIQVEGLLMAKAFFKINHK